MARRLVSRLLRAVRSLLAGLFGLALLVGLPLALWRFIGNPLDLLPDTWDEARRMAQQRNVTTDVMLAALAAVMWVLWLQFVWATLWELFVIGPKAGRGEVAREAPGVPRFIRSIVSLVSSGLLSASVVASASSAGSLLPDLVASAPVLASEFGQSDLMPDDDDATSATNVAFYRIADHDRVWDLAGQNDAVLQRILEMNSDQVKSPIDFRPGMKIRVPASLNLPDAVTDEAALDPVDAPSGGVADAADHVVYEVVEGDNLWNISKVHLADAADGEKPSNQEILEEVHDVVERNPDVIEDPDLIYPGELLTLRSVEDATDASEVAHDVVDEVVDGSDRAEASTSAADEQVDDTAHADPLGARGDCRASDHRERDAGAGAGTSRRQGAGAEVGRRRGARVRGGRGARVRRGRNRGGRNSQISTHRTRRLRHGCSAGPPCPPRCSVSTWQAASTPTVFRFAFLEKVWRPRRHRRRSCRQSPVRPTLDSSPGSPDASTTRSPVTAPRRPSRRRCWSRRANGWRCSGPIRSC